METYKKWLAELSEVDELMGKKPKHPYNLLRYHINNELKKQNEIIESSSSKISNNISNATSVISGTLEDGFNMLIDTNTKGFKEINENLGNIQHGLNTGFDNIVTALDNINSTLEWNFSKIIELDFQRNILLNDIIQLLNIPDIEKERKLNIEKGLEFIKKTIIDNSFIDDAKKYFERALELEPNDYYVLYNLGIIHFYYKKHLNFEKAKKYFLKAGKYAFADISFKSTKYSTHQSSFKNNINPKTIAAFSFLYAARCNYYLHKYNDALISVKKAYELLPNNIDIIYDTAKLLLCNNQKQKAINFLSRAIEIDRYVTLKVLTDIDFMKHKEISFFFKDLRDNKIDEAKKKYELAIKIIRPDSRYKKDLEKISKYLQKNTYLSAMSALDTL